MLYSVRASTRQPVARASRPRTSPRPPRPTSRTYPRAARTGGLDTALDGAQSRRTARNRACDAPQQPLSATGIGSGGFVAPIRSPMTVSVTPAVAPMRLVSAGTTANTCAGRDGCERVSTCGRWLPARTFTWAGSGLPDAAEAMSSAPASRSALPMRPRLLL